MAQKKTMKITFPNGGIVPAAELRPFKKDAEDRQVSPNVPVIVSGTYGQQLVDDKFAVEFDGNEVEAAAKVEADAKAKVEADAKAKVEADAKAKVEADAKAKVEADAKGKTKAGGSGNE